MSVRAETGSTAPTTLTPLRSDSGRRRSTRAAAELPDGLLDLEPDLAVVEQQLHAGRSAAKISGWGSGTRSARARRRVEVEANAAPGVRVSGLGEPADAQLGPLQVGQDADRPADFPLDARG